MALRAVAGRTVPPGTTDITDAQSKFRVGPNGAGQPGHYGPQPPDGHGPHHDYFWVYALNTQVDGAPIREQFLERYKDNIIEQNRVVGIYEN